MVKLNSATLIEVLVAMVILLCVFGIGLMIFSNLDRSNTTLESRIVKNRLNGIAKQYEQDRMINKEITIDSILYQIKEYPIDGLDDRIKVAITAYRMLDNVNIGSVNIIQSIDNR